MVSGGIKYFDANSYWFDAKSYWFDAKLKYLALYNIICAQYASREE